MRSLRGVGRLRRWSMLVVVLAIATLAVSGGESATPAQSSTKVRVAALTHHKTTPPAVTESLLPASSQSRLSKPNRSPFLLLLVALAAVAFLVQWCRRRSFSGFRSVSVSRVCAPRGPPVLAVAR
jgi:hypothetical protein